MVCEFVKFSELPWEFWTLNTENYDCSIITYSNATARLYGDDEMTTTTTYTFRPLMSGGGGWPKHKLNKMIN